MRTFFTSFMAFFLSGFAGGMVAQLIAEWTHATEEFILVFMLSGLVTMAVTVAFFVAQLLSNPAAAVATTGKWLLIAACVLSAGLVGLSFWADGFHAPDSKETWLMIGLALPALVTIAVHWAFVRWRLRPAAQAFGRGPGAPA